MKNLMLWFLLIFPGFAIAALPSADMQSTESVHDVSTTTERLQQALEAAGFKIFAQVDHAAAAAGIGMELRPTQLLIFGKPKVGTLLMQSNQLSGIDLPLKFLVWQDVQGKVWIGWNDMAAIGERHQLINRGPVLEKVAGALQKFARNAALP